MKSLFDYLEKAQYLQKKTFDSKVNIDISKRIDDDGPWFVVTATVEGWDVKPNNGHYRYFGFYQFLGPEELKGKYDELEKAVYDWINKL